MKHHRFFLPFLLLALTVSTQAQMFYKDSDRTGVPFAKDPVVVSLNGRYLMYYSVPPYADKSKGTGWNIGIAESQDLENWKKIGEMIGQIRVSFLRKSIEHKLRRTVTDTSAGNISVLNVDDRVFNRVAGKIMDDDFTVLTKLN